MKGISYIYFGARIMEEMKCEERKLATSFTVSTCSATFLGPNITRCTFRDYPIIARTKTRINCSDRPLNEMSASFCRLSSERPQTLLSTRPPIILSFLIICYHYFLSFYYYFLFFFIISYNFIFIFHYFIIILSSQLVHLFCS